MSTIIIAIVIAVAVGAFLVMRARQNKDDVKDKKSKNVSTKKSAATKESATPAATPAKTEPKVDLNNLITQLNLLIADKEYAKAEASINLHLKQDPSLHQLYLKLAEIYHAQEDDFAIKQLLDTLQKLNLNEVYQTVFNENEIFKAEQEKRKAAEESKKTPDVFEFTPSTPVAPVVDNSLSFDSLANESTTAKDNSLDFASLSSDLATPAPVTVETGDTQTLNFDVASTPVTEQTTTLDFNLDTPTTAPTKEESNSLSLDSTPASPTLDFNLDAPSSVQDTPSEPSLDFKLDVPSTVQDTPSEPSLDFKLDVPSSVQNTPSEPSLDFKLDVPVQESAPATESFSFDLSTPETKAPEAASPNLDFSLDSATIPTSAPNLDFNLSDTPASTQPQTATQYVDLNDPIAQSFSELAETNPIDLDIELAEQYIRLGATTAAKSLLQQHTNLSAEQADKVGALLQKIA